MQVFKEKNYGYCLLKQLILIVFGQVIILHHVFSQQQPVIAEQLVESAISQHDESETEDDGPVQQLQYFSANPLNLNYASAADLKDLGLLSAGQIDALISYRNLLGKFVHLYEIQAVPEWDIYTIEKIRLFVTVSLQNNLIATLRHRLKGGEKKVLFRASQFIEKSKGYNHDTAVIKDGYQGSPQKILFRYKYQFKNLLQYGLVAEKDPGEQFFKDRQKLGFDFYSGHLFIRKSGIIKALALGDFTVNLAQGLIFCQNLAFKKSADVLNIKRQLPVIQPYNSAGEFNFLRGVGLTLAKNNLELSLFSSFRKLDANLINEPTLLNSNQVSSFLTSGYHRTKTEQINRQIQHQQVFGGNAAVNFNKLHIGVNAALITLSVPLKKTERLYNLYAPAGKQFNNYSIDYSYTHKNWHFFGETALSWHKHLATVNGILLSVDSKADLGILYRNISPGYYAFYGNAFTEQATVSNEQGLYAGISIRPVNSWRIDAYFDYYKFPWLKYQVNKPVQGIDYLVQATYKPDKKLEIYIRYKTASTNANEVSEENILTPVSKKMIQSIRANLTCKLNKEITIRNRAELVYYNKNIKSAQNGFLAYLDLIYKPLQSKISGNLRIQYFETDGYDSRLYAYENDVLYSSSIPVIYDIGSRYYININYDITNKLSCWLRWAQTMYTNKTTVGSGLDEVKGNKRSEIKLQLEFRF